MRTRGQAAKVAAVTGGAHLAGKPKPDGTPSLSRYVDVGADFEAHRAAVESVSVLFDLYDGDADGYAQTGSPGEPLPTGWVVTAAKFEVQWPTEPERAALVRSHFGARRKAFNWGLAQVKADLEAKTIDPSHESVGWDPGSLRWAWNHAKEEVAPWWAQNSKEAYSSGLTDLARALGNWSASKMGRRKGPSHHHRAGDRRSAGQGEHPPSATKCHRGPGPDLEHDAVAAVGAVVRLDRLRDAHTDHRAHRHPAVGSRRGRSRRADLGNRRHD
jgi:hypothetical protein